MSNLILIFFCSLFSYLFYFVLLFFGACFVLFDMRVSFSPDWP